MDANHNKQANHRRGARLRKLVALIALTLATSAGYAQQTDANATAEENTRKLLNEGCKLWGCTTDAGAVAKMTPAERKLQEALQKIPAETSITQLQALLGPIHRGAGTPRPVWLGPDKSKESQIAVYVKDNKIALIRWLKMRQWLWERAPSPEK